MATKAELLDQAKEITKVSLVPQLVEKEFKSGSVGYYANGKVIIDGKKFQAQLMLVEVGSKDKKKK